jgi:hypothetical protein
MAAVLASFLAVAGTGCGKREGGAPPGGNLPASGDTSPAAAGGGAQAAGKGEVTVSAGGFTVVVAPMFPSRIAPPSVSVRSPLGKGAEIAGVRWIVNGAERESGRSLSPSGFQRGDRIRAVVVLRTAEGERTVETPEAVAANALPEVAEVRLDPPAPVSGGTIRAIAEARDPDGDPLTIRYRWHVDNVAIPGESESIVLKGVKKGSWVHAAATPNDGSGDGAWKYSSRHQVVNAPPVLKSSSPTTVPPSRVLTHVIVAEDPDGDPMTYHLIKGPEGMAMAGSTLTWKVSDRDLDRTAEVVIRISDDDGASTVLTMVLAPRKP